MKYYLIGEVEITDPSWVPDYIKQCDGNGGAIAAGDIWLARRSWRG